MPNRRITDLPVLPDGENLTNVQVGVDNENNSTSYKVSVQKLLDDATNPTNLAYVPKSDEGDITNDNGTGLTIPAVDLSNAGLALPDDRRKLDLITINLAIDLDAVQEKLAEVDNHQSIFGVPAGSIDMLTFSGGILTDNTSIKVNLQELSDAIEAIDSAEIDNLFQILGVPKGSTNMLQFTGSVLTDNTSVKVNLQELSDAIELMQNNPAPTNLGYAPNPILGTITNDNGTPAEIPAVDNTNAGLALPGHKVKLDRITISAPINLDQLKLDTDTNTVNLQNVYQTFGTTLGNTDMGPFNGPHLTDNTSVRVNLQELSDAIQNNTGPTELSWSVTGDIGQMFSSTAAGPPAQIPVATLSDAGLLSIGDKQKLEYITINAPEDINDMSADIADHQLVLGVPKGSVDLGNFNGTVLPGNLNIKQALQILADAVGAGPTDVPEVLDDLDDVDTTTTPPQNGWSLVYNNGTWVPQDVAGGGGGATNLGWVQATAEITSSTGTSAFPTDVTSNFRGLATPQMLTDISNLQSLGGVGGDSNLGTFPGTIITDGVSIKQALTELEAEVDQVGGGLQAVVEDPAPQLGGPLLTNGQLIGFESIDDNSFRGLMGAVTTTGDSNPGVFMGYSTNLTIDVTDGGIKMEPGKVELYGSTVQIPAWDIPTTEIRNVVVDAEGNLFTNPLATGWSQYETDVSGATYDLGTGSGVGAWVQITGLQLNPQQDVDAGDPLDIFTSLRMQNKTLNRAGTVEVGFGYNGAQPAAGGITHNIPDAFDGWIAEGFRDTGHGGLTTADTVSIWARRTSGENPQFGVNVVADAHEFQISVPGQSTAGVDNIHRDSTGSSGVSLVGAKVSEYLEFKTLISSDASVSISGLSTDVDLTVDLSGLAPIGTTITAGNGLAGGGDLSTDRKIDLDLNDLTTGTTIDDADLIGIYDASDLATENIAYANFMAGRAVDVAANGGLGGGGSLLTSINDLAVDPTNAATETVIADTDLFLMHDASAGGLRAITWANIKADVDTGGGGVPLTRTLSTVDPLLIDGGNSADLSGNRTFSFDITQVGTETIADGDLLIFQDISVGGVANRKVTWGTLKADISGGNLSWDAASSEVRIDTGGTPAILTVVGANNGLMTPQHAKDIGDHQLLIGVAQDSTNMGLYTGTIVGDNGTVKQNIQDLEDHFATIADASITSGVLPVAQANREADFNGNDIDFTDVGTFTVNPTTAAVYTMGPSADFTTAAFALRNSSTTNPGTVSFYESSSVGGNSVSIRGPVSSAIPTSYFIELPNAQPADNQILAVATGTGGTLPRLEWVDPATGGGDVPSTRRIDPTNLGGLQGGGDLSQDREFALDLTNLTAPPADIQDADTFVMMDASDANTHKQITFLDIKNNIPGLDDTSITTGTLASAQALRTVPMNSQGLVFDQVGGYQINSSFFEVRNWFRTLEGAGIELYESVNAGQTHSIEIQAATNVTADYKIRLPGDVPEAADVLRVQSISAGVADMEWADPTDTVSNVGGEQAVYKGFNSGTGAHEFYTLWSGDGSVTFGVNADRIDIRAVDPATGGEANRLSNVGGGAEVALEAANGVLLEVKTLTSSDGSITFTPGAQTLDLSGVDPTTTITARANSGLEGGGDLTASREIWTNFYLLTAEAGLADGDYFIFEDTSVSGQGNTRRVTWAEMKATIPGAVDTNLLEGTYSAAQTDRFYPFNNQSANFNSVNVFTVDGQEIRLTGTPIAVYGDNTAAAVFTLHAGNDANNVQFGVPQTVNTDYTLLLPPVPGSAGQYLKIDANNANTLTTSWDVPAGGAGALVYDNVAELRTISSLTDGDMAWTRGHTNEGIGAAQYMYHESGWAGKTDVGGWEIQAAGADDWFEMVEKDTINVQQWGAIGDGLTDNLTALQNACARGALDGVQVVVPAGIYSAPGGIVADLSTPGQTLDIRGEGNPTLLGPDDNVQYCLRGRIGTGMRVEGITFRDWKWGCYFTNSTNGSPHLDIDISGCTFINCENGINDGGFQPSQGGWYTTVNVRDCIAQTMRQGGIRVRAQSAKSVRVHDCQVYDVNSTTDAQGIMVGADVSGTVCNGQVSGCKVENVDTTAAQPCYGIIVYGEQSCVEESTVKNITGTAGATDCAGIYTKTRWGRVSGCSAINAGTLNQGSIAIKGGDRDDIGSTVVGYGTTVVNNTVHSDNSIPRKGILVSAEECTLTGNVIDGCEEGIICTDADGTVATGNRVNAAKFGMQMFDCDRCNFSDNILDASGNPAPWSVLTAQIYINTSGGTTNYQNTIHNNVIKGSPTTNTGYGIYINPTASGNFSHFSVKGNDVRDCNDVGIQLSQQARLTNFQVDDNQIHNCPTPITPGWNEETAIADADLLPFEDTSLEGSGNQRYITFADFKDAFPPGGGGEVNNGVSIGDAGVDVYSGMVSTDLGIRKIKSTNGSVTVGLDGDAINLTAAAGTDTSITQDNLDTATATCNVPMANNDLLFQSPADFRTVAGGDHEFVNTDFRVVHRDSNTAATVKVYESANQGTNYLGVSAPATMSQTQNLIFPAFLPSPNEVLKVNAVNGNDVTLEWDAGGGTDTSITGNNLANATEACTVPMNSQNLKFDATQTLEFDSALTYFLPSSLTGEQGSIFLFESTAAGGTNSVRLSAPTDMTSDWTLRLPAAAGTPGQVLAIDTESAGVVETVWTTAAGGGSRKDDADILGTDSGTVPLDMASGNFDNKILELTADATIQLAQLTRGGRYILYLNSDQDGTRREITWQIAGGATMQFGQVALGNAPGFVDTAGSMKVIMDYDQQQDILMIEPMGEIEQVVDASTLPATWAPDFGYGMARTIKVTGVFGGATTLDTPLRLPIGETMLLHFTEPQTQTITLAVASHLIYLTPDPDWTSDNAVITIHRTSEGYLYAMANGR